jgi:hypothetical protein
MNCALDPTYRSAWKKAWRNWRALAGIQPRLSFKPNIEVAAPDTAVFSESLKELYDTVLPPPMKANYHKMTMDHSLREDMKRTVRVLQRMERMFPEEKGAGAEQAAQDIPGQNFMLHFATVAKYNYSAVPKDGAAS